MCVALETFSPLHQLSNLHSVDGRSTALQKLWVKNLRRLLPVLQHWSELTTKAPRRDTFFGHYSILIHPERFKMSTRRWEDNIKLYHRRGEYEYAEWILPCTVPWRTFVTSVINPQLPDTRDFLATSSSSQSIIQIIQNALHLHGSSCNSFLPPSEWTRVNFCLSKSLLLWGSAAGSMEVEWQVLAVGTTTMQSSAS